jgi:hypothetical protein
MACDPAALGSTAARLVETFAVYWNVDLVRRALKVRGAFLISAAPRRPIAWYELPKAECHGLCIKWC